MWIWLLGPALPSDVEEAIVRGSAVTQEAEKRGRLFHRKSLSIHIHSTSAGHTGRTFSDKRTVRASVKRSTHVWNRDTLHGRHMGKLLLEIKT